MHIRGQRGPTIDQLVELPYPVDTHISPDGRRVVFEVSTPDWRQNVHVTQLWLAVLDDEGKPDSIRQLTFTRFSSYGARWSPNGEWLAFLSARERDGRPQIYRLSPFGGEAERLTAVSDRIEFFEWSPDSESIAFLAADGESEADRARRQRYGTYVVQNEDFRRSQLWLLTLANRQRQLLTRDQPLHAIDFAWSPDASTVAVTGATTPEVEELEKSLIYLVDVTTGAFEALTEPGCYAPHWSSGGEQVACLRHGSGFHDTNTLWIYDVATRLGQAAPLEFDEYMDLLRWGEGGLFFSAVQRTSEHLFLFNPNTATVEQVTPQRSDGLVARDFHFDAACRRVVFIGGDRRRVDEVMLLHLESGDVHYLTDYQARVADLDLRPPEVVSWSSEDGTEIEGVLYKPADFDPQQRYPLLVVLHDGPAGTSFLQILPYENRRYYPIQQWVTRGALVLMPNYRGSAGYGARFRALNVRNLGLGDYADVISGVDMLIERGWVDPERLAAMGWSQGGYISAFIATYSDRFCAVSVGAGISNWVTYYVSTDVGPFTRHYLQGTPWEERDIYDKTSPMTYIKQACTPTLIQHGERDQRVPLPNAYELYQGLKDVGVETKLVVYPGMPHGITQPRQNRQVLEENWRWFNRLLWSEPEARPAGRICYVSLPEEARVASVARKASAAEVDFRVLTARWGLMSPEKVDVNEDALSMGQFQVQRCIGMIAEQIGTAGWNEIYLFNGDPQMSSPHLMLVGALLIAAGSVGGVSVEHAVAEIDGQ